MDVTLRQLRYFVAVAEQLHFTVAAEQLFISQPALSKQIRSLETLLQTTLFDRDRRGVRLTPAGLALLPQARATLAAWGQAQRDLAAAIAAQARLLTIGMSTGIGRGLLPAARARFAATDPDAQLRIRQVSWADPTGGLAAPVGSGTDAAFIWLPQPDPDRLAWTEVATEARLVALPEGHPLTERAVVAFDDLQDEEFLALPASSGVQRDFWLALDQRGGRRVRVGAEVRTTEETVEALAAGAGVVLFAEGNGPMLARDEIVIRPVSGLPPAQLVLAWRRDDSRAIVGTFVAALRSCLAEPPDLSAPQRAWAR